MLLKTVKVIRSKESLRNVIDKRSLRRHKQLNVMWYPEWDLEREKGEQVKIKEIQIKCGL